MQLTEERITNRIDTVTGIGEDRLGTILPPPRSVKIGLTDSCNYACSFCVQSIRQMSGNMDRALYTKVLHELADAGVEEAGLFFLGESFLLSWLPEAVQEAKELFPYVFLTTNGASATPKKVEACMAAGLDSLKFSLNFHSPGQLAEVAKVPEARFQTVLDNIKAAHEIKMRGGYHCNIYASSIALDGEQGEKMRAVIDSIRPYIDEAYQLPLYSMSGAAVAAGLKPQPGNPGRLDNMRDPLPCWSVFSEVRVDRHGNVIACCFGPGMNDEFIMGNVQRESFMTIWNNEKYQSLRAAHLRKDVTGTPCESCAAGG